MCVHYNLNVQCFNFVHKIVIVHLKLPEPFYVSLCRAWTKCQKCTYTKYKLPVLFLWLLISFSLLILLAQILKPTILFIYCFKWRAVENSLWKQTRKSPKCQLKEKLNFAKQLLKIRLKCFGIYMYDVYIYITLLLKIIIIYTIYKTLEATAVCLTCVGYGFRLVYI